MAAIVFTAFIYLLFWIAVAISVVPDAVRSATGDDVLRIVLNLGVSGSLLVVPLYALYRIASSDKSRPAPGAR
jgi:hypothetical protein